MKVYNVEWAKSVEWEFNRFKSKSSKSRGRVQLEGGGGRRRSRSSRRHPYWVAWRDFCTFESQSWDSRSSPCSHLCSHFCPTLPSSSSSSHYGCPSDHLPLPPNCETLCLRTSYSFSEWNSLSIHKKKDNNSVNERKGRGEEKKRKEEEKERKRRKGKGWFTKFDKVVTLQFGRLRNLRRMLWVKIACNFFQVASGELVFVVPLT